MSFNPNILPITYQKYSGIVPNTTVEFVAPEGTIFTQIPEITEKPAWINLILEETHRNESNEIIKFTYKVAIIPEQANNLTGGFHTGVTTVKARFKRLFAPAFYTSSLTVNLRVLENVQLSLSQTAFQFNHTIGNPAPAAQYLTIDTSANWSIVAAEAWLLFSAGNGTGRQVISLSVNVSGLAAGLYTSSFLVDDGTGQKSGTVNLKITGSGDENDYLNVSPAVIEFSETYLQPSASEANVQIDSSLPVVVTSNVNWLELSAVNIAAGFNTVTVSTQATNILQIGSYPAEIKITSAYSVRVIYVLLHVIEVTSTGIESNGFYFAEDRNTLSLTTGTNNAEAVIDFRTLGTLEVKNYQKRTPFYRNFANVIIGLETRILLRPYALPPLSTQAFIPVKPIQLNFTLYDKSLTNAAMVERAVYSNVQFLNGNTPVKPNILSYLPGTLSVPKDAVIAFAFIENSGLDFINITGAVTVDIPVSAQNTTVYGVFVNLADLALNPYDSITITCGPVQVMVKIKPTQLSTCRLIYLNEWDCPEIINFDGPLQVIYEDGSTTAVTNRAGKDYSSIIEIKKPRSYKIGTGNIHTDAEVLHLAEILNSTKSWLEINGEIIEVIRTFKSLPVFETRRNSRNFTLTFDSAIK